MNKLHASMFELKFSPWSLQYSHVQVLNLWLERKIMPESVLRHFVNEIESHGDDKAGPGNGPRHLSRSERAVDDPVRDMDGMLVDEYGR
jgi:hypothetical protein